MQFLYIVYFLCSIIFIFLFVTFDSMHNDIFYLAYLLDTLEMLLFLIKLVLPEINKIHKNIIINIKFLL